MADEKDSNLDPSQPDNDEASTQSQHDADAATPHPSDATDPETRMLEQLAALHDDSDSVPTTEVPDVQDDDVAEPVEASTQRTAMLPPVVEAGTYAPTAGPGVRPRKKKRRWAWGIGIGVLLLGGGYVGAAFATQDTLPATLTVEGVDVSGRSVDEAAPVLEAAFAERAQREITVAVEGNEATIVPADAGYAYDVDATLDELTELTFEPAALWSRLFGKAAVSAEQTIDQDVASEAIAGLAEQLTFDPTEGAVAFDGASVDYTAPVNGFTLDQDALAEQLAAEWLSDTTVLEASGDVEAPGVSAEQWEQFVADTAEPLVADAYTVTADGMTAQLAPEQLAAAADVLVQEADAKDGAEETAAAAPSESAAADAATGEPQNDHPVLLLDAEALTDSLAENNPDFASTNEDATVRLAGSAGSGRPEVVPGETGRGVNGEQVVDAILADLAGEQARAVTVELHEVEPKVTTEDAEAWDVTHTVADYATPYPAHDGPRTANLRVGAERINGTVVMPGEEFNLNALLAPITAANGYHQSGVVESGVTTTALGGGLSQIATMAYNAGFLGGMEIVEHKPHSRWFDRYPRGRESTYWEGQINVRWKNDTDAPVIVEMWLADSQVHTRLWGSDYYDVTTSTSEPYNYTASPTIRNNDSQCIPESGGRQGFTVDVHRTKTPPSGEAIQESWRWAYSGWPTVICE